MVKKCIAHRAHIPVHHTTEEHHVIPQAWQHFKLSSEALFDPRTVTLCPTGHRNVHVHLVGMMKTMLTDPVEMRKAWKKRRCSESDLAYVGITRYIEAGGDLAALQAVHIWGIA